MPSEAAGDPRPSSTPEGMPRERGAGSAPSGGPQTPSDRSAEPSDAEPAPPDETSVRLHPATLLFQPLRSARQLLLPGLLFGLTRDPGGPRSLVLLVLGMVAMVSLPLAIWHALVWSRFRYRLGDDELVLDSGVLSRERRVIPIVRVQNIDLRETALQRLAGVVEVRVETAGGAGRSDARLAVVSRAEGQRLREQISARRRVLRRRLAEDGGTAGAAAGEVAAPAAEQPATVLARLTPRDLAIAGATANEAGLIAAGVAALMQYATDALIDRAPLLSTFFERFGGATLSDALLLGAIVLVAVFAAGWVVSIVGSVVGYHAFTLERTLDGDTLRKRFGLIGRRQTLVPLERVQAARIEESLLRRPFGLAALKIETAAGAPGERGGAEAFLPIARKRDVPALLRGVFADLDLEGVRFTPVHPRSRRRAFIRYGALLLALGALWVWRWGGELSDAHVALIGASLLLAAWLLAGWQYRHRGFAVLPGYVLARGGVLNRITWVIPERKLQTLHVTATPFQRRYGLATLVLDTASGGRQGRVIDLGAPTARAMFEALADRLPRATRADARRARGGA